MRHPFRRKNLSPRLLPLYALAVAAFLLARPTPTSFLIGSLLVAAGAALRFWGAGYLVKNDLLSVAGPYAHLRHPLYAGTLCLALGFGVIAGGWALALVLGCFLPLFFFYYLPYKERVESARLERRHGDAYAEYHRAVPALLPSLNRFTPEQDPGPARERWSFERLRENDEHGTMLGIGVALLLLALRPLLPP
ncbi:MAG TPA: isoprenylcysteine carboxylmethyltransferase family protein [Myxococcota bacterium]